jgi:hypothetical protein
MQAPYIRYSAKSAALTDQSKAIVAQKIVGESI